MLKIINDLKLYFEDCYRRINIREYARLMGISPPTASKLLSYYVSKGILIKTKYKKYILFYPNNQNKLFVDLSRIYWAERLRELIEYLEKKLINPTIILFGSLSKGEAKLDSDIDLAIFAYKKELDLENFEKKLKRKIRIHWFKSLKEIKNKELANNIINGYILRGKIVL
jgi:predicted nucleotidyltransferase